MAFYNWRTRCQQDRRRTTPRLHSTFAEAASGNGGTQRSNNLAEIFFLATKRPCEGRQNPGLWFRCVALHRKSSFGKTRVSSENRFYIREVLGMGDWEPVEEWHRYLKDDDGHLVSEVKVEQIPALCFCCCSFLLFFVFVRHLQSFDVSCCFASFLAALLLVSVCSARCSCCSSRFGLLSLVVLLLLSARLRSRWSLRFAVFFVLSLLFVERCVFSGSALFALLFALLLFSLLLLLLFSVLFFSRLRCSLFSRFWRSLRSCFCCCFFCVCFFASSRASVACAAVLRRRALFFARLSVFLLCARLLLGSICWYAYQVTRLSTLVHISRMRSVHRLD